MPEALTVSLVSKIFKVYDNPRTGPLLDVLSLGRRRDHYREFVAVDNVSFKVERGEVVGIVGPNGSGKTTLLKMIAGLLRVDRGSIVVDGKVTALLALGVGVHPEFSGRENIVYGGMLLGMRREEIEAKVESIIAFSELEDFIDRPFRTYSSGMKARLLFSVAMSVDPDILIVDEALATGDAYFIDKCVAKIEEICRSGATVLFVSHNLVQIKRLCSRAILLAGGRNLLEGEPAEVLQAYQDIVREREGRAAVAREGDFIPVSRAGELDLRSVRVVDPKGGPGNAFISGAPMRIEIDYVGASPDQEYELFIGFLRGVSDDYIGEINSRYFVEQGASVVRQTTLELDRDGRIAVDIDALLLLNDHYRLWVLLANKEETEHIEYRGVCPFFIARESNALSRGAAFWQPCRIGVETGVRT